MELVSNLLIIGCIVISTYSSLHERASNFILEDHFKLVFDLDKSFDNFIVDKNTGKQYLDAVSFFASNPIGYNHPKLLEKQFSEKLLRCARTNPANSNILTEEYVEFMETFFEVAVPAYFTKAFFIAGGALAVENALKTAFDWKCKKLLEQGKSVDPNKLKVIHFQNSFHGRTGYTISITSTDKNEYEFFPMFTDWIRLDAPSIDEKYCIEDQDSRDKEFFHTAFNLIEKQKDECAAIIVEPIQGKGGDVHFTKHFHENLRYIADKLDIILIHDEVQTGVGLTGKMWAHEHYGVFPDILCFGKKMQVCGILVNERITQVRGNVFQEFGRIDSTWGGNLVDMVRGEKYLQIIAEDNLVQNAEKVGEYLQSKLVSLGLNNVRGKGLMCAFDCTSADDRNSLIKKCYDNGLFVIGCGTKSIRLRPSLTFSQSDVDLMISILSTSI